MVTALGPMLVDDPNDEAFVEANEAVEADGESKFKPFGFFSGVPDNEFKKIDWNPLVPEVNNGDFWKNNVLICKSLGIVRQQILGMLSRNSGLLIVDFGFPCSKVCLDI